ncbi:MAG: hypothetical protein HUU35_17590, partial [Armatimonadetes bacterium]|nr:hypothetical protein [Armatimonadota bacterium]
MTSRLLLGLLAAGALTAAPLLDPNLTEFPSSSLVDFGARLDSPGGFLTVDERGRFVWPDGRRARFWGINVAAESVFQPPERIDTCIARIREAGFNLVRLHHIDDRERGILAGDGPGVEFDPARLRLLDYWVDRLGAAGISIYLDLLDYRWFDTGRLGRAAKPYAVFDPELIARQQEYARALLREHRNAFNGRAYADDPAIVLLELFDENGLFIRRADWPNLLEPYRSDLTARWNRYLLQRYGSSEGLAAAWARSGVAQPLPAGQLCEEGTVPL